VSGGRSDRGRSALRCTRQVGRPNWRKNPTHATRGRWSRGTQLQAADRAPNSSHRSIGSMRWGESHAPHGGDRGRRAPRPARFPSCRNWIGSVEQRRGGGFLGIAIRGRQRREQLQIGSGRCPPFLFLCSSARVRENVGAVASLPDRSKQVTMVCWQIASSS
jgi:hypothetical protein